MANGSVEEIVPGVVIGICAAERAGVRISGQVQEEKRYQGGSAFPSAPAVPNRTVVTVAEMPCNA